MSQHDMTVDNGSGLGVRTDLNNGLQALASLSSGASAPSPSFPCQLWADTGTSRLKRRNAANTAWLDEGPLDAALRDAASQGEFVVDTGSAGAYACNFVPAITARSESTPLRFKAANANTGACTINDGVGTVALVGSTHAALQGGEIIANGIAWIQWNASVGGGSYVLLFCTGAPQQVADASKSKHAATAGQLVAQGLTAFTTAGTSPTFTLTPAPALGSYAANQRFRVKFSAAAATSGTLNVSGLGAKNLKQYDSTGAKVTAVIASGQLADVEYDGTDMVILNPTPPATITPTDLETAIPAISRCTAWVLFIGTGTPSIRGSFNVSSVVRLGTGNYTVNFASSMTNTTYSVTYSCDSESDAVNVFTAPATARIVYIQDNLKANGSFRVLSGANSAGGGTTVDFRAINLQVMGGK